LAQLLVRRDPLDSDFTGSRRVKFQNAEHCSHSIRANLGPSRTGLESSNFEQGQIMPNITATAKQFFAACETGKGWAGCREYCTPNATFSAQAEPLANVKTLEEYTEWMKGLLTFIPDGRYEVKSFATDDDRKSVCAYGIFSGTHTGEGGPCPPTGKRTDTDYVYVMEFDGDKIRQMTKIWNAGWAMRDLGWAA
jgi:predicted ester cyclase